MSAPLPVAAVGVGHLHAPAYLRLLRARPDVEVVAVWDVDPGTAASRAEIAGAPVAASADAAISAARAVLVCAEPTRQGALVAMAAEAGRPTLCEKPLGTTPEESAGLLALADRIPLSVAFPVRYHPSAISLRRAVRDGRLGEVAAVWGTNRNCFPGGWFGDPDLAGGGCLLDHVVHVVDLVAWIWDTGWASVRAEAGTLHHPGLAVEDTAMVLAEATSGLALSLDPSMSRPTGMPGALDLTMLVWGSRGIATLNVFPPGTEAAAETGVLSRVPLGSNMDRDLLDAWIASVGQETGPPVPAQAGYSATMLAHAARRSASEGRAITIDPT